MVAKKPQPTKNEMKVATDAIAQTIHTAIKEAFADLKEEMRIEIQSLVEAKQAKPDLRVVKDDSSRRARGILTPSESFYKPILKILDDSDGIASSSRIFSELPSLVKLSEDDKQITPSTNKPSWYGIVYKAKREMKTKNLLTASGWKMTSNGRKWLTAN